MFDCWVLIRLFSIEILMSLCSIVFQYHPDVCRGSNCGVQFHLINEAYDVSYSTPLNFSCIVNELV